MTATANTTSSSAVELMDVRHAFGRTQALAGVTLTVPAGERVAITGPSGCGKSTLMQIAAGLFLPTSGTAALLGSDLASLSLDDRARLRRTKVSLILQFGQLVPDMTAIDNVALPLILEGASRKAAAERALAALEQTGVADSAETMSQDLSGGQAQRVAAARALITEPEIIFADEPTASLDAMGAEEIMNLLVDYSRIKGAALVVVTHNNLVAASLDREVRLREGVIVSEGSIR